MTTEENPLYLFDRWFVDNVPGMTGDWEVLCAATILCVDDMVPQVVWPCAVGGHTGFGYEWI